MRTIQKMLKFKEFLKLDATYNLTNVNENWWDKVDDDVSVYLIGKSRKRDYIKITHLTKELVEVWVVNAGVGGEFNGTISNAKTWLTGRLQSLGTAVSGGSDSWGTIYKKLNLVKGVDILK